MSDAVVNDLVQAGGGRLSGVIQQQAGGRS